MAENDHIMTTRSKLRSRTSASDDTNTTFLPDAPESTTSTKRTTNAKSKASSNKTKPTTTSKSAGKKPVYNPDPDPEAEDIITVSKRSTGKESVYDPDPGSDAEDNITVLEPGATTKAKVSKGKQRQRSNASDYEFSDPPPQAPEPRAVHPDYPDLPPEVPVNIEGIPTAYFAKVNGKVQIWDKKRGN
ncbi:hypothetical protein KCU64_g2833, partial [Aureobasidium melanogenum]